MKKNGFVFIETIVVVVVLSASLLVLYNSYSSSISKEKERLYFDDMAYIYRTNFLRKFLEENTNIENIKEYVFHDAYATTIGVEFANMFTEEQEAMKNSLNNMIANFHVHRMILLSKDYILNCSLTSEDEKCQYALDNLSLNFASYLKTVNSVSYDAYLVVEYAEKIDNNGKVIPCNPGSDKKCSVYYTSLGI